MVVGGERPAIGGARDPTPQGGNRLPGGVYAYCLQLPNKEVSGDSGEEWGTMFFPLGSREESFEEFGWPPRQRDSEHLASEDSETTVR